MCELKKFLIGVMTSHDSTNIKCGYLDMLFRIGYEYSKVHYENCAL